VRVLSPRARAEQRCVTNPAPAQFRLANAQRGDDLFSINASARTSPVKAG
jgi:hypothetical protein